MEEPGERMLDTPEQPDPVSAAPEQTPLPPATRNWWRALAESCKGRLPAMYRVFLDMCTGVLKDDLLTVYAPDDMTLGRLDNDRVKGILSEEAQQASGVSVRLTFRVGKAPAASPQENLKNLLNFGSQFDNIEIK